MNTVTPTKCALAGCNRPNAGTPWSKYCPMHAVRQMRNGSAGALALRPRELLVYREDVARVLAKYSDSDAVKPALLIADDILNYRPRFGWSRELRLVEQMNRLRAGGVTARELLQRVCEVRALQYFDQRFSTARELDHTVGREIFKLRSMHRWRPTGHDVRFLGEHVRNELGTFPAALCRTIEKDHETRQRARHDFEHGWSIRE